MLVRSAIHQSFSSLPPPMPARFGPLRVYKWDLFGALPEYTPRMTDLFRRKLKRSSAFTLSSYHATHECILFQMATTFHWRKICSYNECLIVNVICSQFEFWGQPERVLIIWTLIASSSPLPLRHQTLMYLQEEVPKFLKALYSEGKGFSSNKFNLGTNSAAFSAKVWLLSQHFHGI